jgi:hypothetical protein
MERIIVLIMFLFLVRMNTVFISAGETKQDEVLIKGTVTEGTTNEPLPGVAVLVKGTSIGTITDVNGRYSIKVSPGQSLQFSYVGYLDEEVDV